MHLLPIVALRYSEVVALRAVTTRRQTAGRVAPYMFAPIQKLASRHVTISCVLSPRSLGKTESWAPVTPNVRSASEPGLCLQEAVAGASGAGLCSEHGQEADAQRERENWERITGHAIHRCPRQRGSAMNIRYRVELTRGGTCATTWLSSPLSSCPPHSFRACPAAAPRWPAVCQANPRP